MAKARKPKRPDRPLPTATRDLVDQLRAAIEDRGATHYQLGLAAQVDPSVITRFVSGERGITLATAARLATALGLRLAEKTGKVGRPTKTARPLETSDE